MLYSNDVMHKINQIIKTNNEFFLAKTKGKKLRKIILFFWSIKIFNHFISHNRRGKHHLLCNTLNECKPQQGKK